MNQCIGYAPEGGRCPWNAQADDDYCRAHRLRYRKPGTRLRLVSDQPGPPSQDPVPAPPVPILAVDAVVYYLGDPQSQLIKIGTTTKLRQRLKTLRHRGWPSAVILATEPGGYDLERTRHLEYRRLRVKLSTTEREWFRKDPMLMKHVNETRHKYGILCPGWPVDFSMIARLKKVS